MRKKPKLPALEKNILKYRALQMVLLLHQVESLKAFVLGSMRATDRIHSGSQEPMLPEGTKKIFKKVWAFLVKEGVITESESQDIQNIIDLRNDIGHSIHNTVMDISGPEFMLQNKKTYDYHALERFEQYREKISEGMRDKFALEIGFRELSFEEAENTYKEELSRLYKKITRQYSIRERKIA
jgi:hypothetical protein